MTAPFYLNLKEAQNTKKFINELFIKRGHIQPVVEVRVFKVDGMTLYAVKEVYVEFPK